MACQHGSAPNWVQRGDNLYNVRSSIGTEVTRERRRGEERSFTVHGPWRYVVRRRKNSLLKGTSIMPG